MIMMKSDREPALSIMGAQAGEVLYYLDEKVQQRRLHNAQDHYPVSDNERSKIKHRHPRWTLKSLTFPS